MTAAAPLRAILAATVADVPSAHCIYERLASATLNLPFHLLAGLLLAPTLVGDVFSRTRAPVQCTSYDAIRFGDCIISCEAAVALGWAQLGDVDSPAETERILGMIQKAYMRLGRAHMLNGSDGAADEALARASDCGERIESSRTLRHSHARGGGGSGAAVYGSSPSPPAAAAAAGSITTSATTSRAASTDDVGDGEGSRRELPTAGAHVVLQNLSSEKYNGACGHVIAATADGTRLIVRLLDSGKEIRVKPTNTVVISAGLGGCTSPHRASSQNGFNNGVRDNDNDDGGSNSGCNGDEGGGGGGGGDHDGGDHDDDNDDYNNHVIAVDARPSVTAVASTATPTTIAPAGEMGDRYLGLSKGTTVTLDFPLTFGGLDGKEAMVVNATPDSNGRVAVRIVSDGPSKGACYQSKLSLI
jgi:hypothetical protein